MTLLDELRKGLKKLATIVACVNIITNCNYKRDTKLPRKIVDLHQQQMFHF
jgi:hypothetical protein